MTGNKDLGALILFAAFSVMIVAVSMVGFFAIHPLRSDISRLQDVAATIVSRKDTNDRNDFIDRRIEKVENDAANARARDANNLNDRIDKERYDLNARIDKYRDDLNARIAQVNQIVGPIAKATKVKKVRRRRRR